MDRNKGLLLGIALLAATLLAPLAAFADGEIWIDVRSEEEYASGHLEGATHVPHTEIAEQITKVTPDKSAPIYLYCKSGGRAGMAKKTLESLGYTNVRNVGSLEDARKMADE